MRTSRFSPRRKSMRRQKLTVLPKKATKAKIESRDSTPITPPTLTVVAKPVESRSLRRPSQKRPSNPLMIIFLYLLRLGIAGVALGAIAGTVLPLVNPTRFFNALSFSAPLAKTAEKPTLQPTTSPVIVTPSLQLTQEIAPLKSKFNEITAKYPTLKPQAFFVDMDNGNYVNFKGNAPIAAASTIKIPILVAFFQDVDAEKIHLDEKLTADKTVIASGSGDLQYQGINQQYSSLDIATKMIIISDNTATNMLIRRLGGKEALNQRFKDWGMSATVINNILPDLEGTNTTSSQDLTLLLAKVSQGELISLKSRDRLLKIMQETKTRTLLPQGLEKGATIAHKTGDIGSVLGDSGIVDIPTGKRYIGTVLTQRPHNDDAGRKLIQEFSRTAYQHFKWYLPRPMIKTTSPNPATPRNNEAN